MKTMQSTGSSSKTFTKETQKNLTDNMLHMTSCKNPLSVLPEERENAVIKQLLEERSRKCRMLERQLRIKEAECRAARRSIEKLRWEYKALEMQYYSMKLRAEALLAEVHSV